MNHIFLSLPQAIWEKVFSYLSFKDIGNLGQVNQTYKALANNCESKKKVVADLINRKILKGFHTPDNKELWLIASMVDEASATPRMISKFIRYKAEEQATLKIIKIAKIIEADQITDAFDAKAPFPIVQTLTMKIPQISESCFVSAIKEQNIDALKLFLNSNKTTVSKEWLLNKAFDHASYMVMQFLFENYPELEVTLNQVLNITNSQGFEIALKQFLKKEDYKITVDALQTMGSQTAYLHDSEKYLSL